MKTLVFWGDASLARARARAAAGAVVLLWGPRHAGLVDPGLKTADLDARAAQRVEAAVSRWTTSLGDRPFVDGRRFGERLTLEGESLWPLAERYFRGPHSAAGRCVRLLETMTVVFESELPDEVEAEGLREDELVLLERGCTARGLLFHGHVYGRVGRTAGDRPTRGRFDFKRTLRGLRSAFGSPPPRIAIGGVLVVWPADPQAALGHLALAAARHALQSEPGLDVARVGGEDGLDAEAFLCGPAREAAQSTESDLRAVWAALRDSPAAAAAFTYDDVVFADLCLASDFEVLLRQLLPRAVRHAEGLREALRASSPRAVVAAADDTLTLAVARAQGVPVVPVTPSTDSARVVEAVLNQQGGAAAHPPEPPPPLRRSESGSAASLAFGEQPPGGRSESDSAASLAAGEQPPGGHGRVRGK